MQLLEKILTLINARGYLRFLPDEVWLKYKFYKTFGYKLDFNNLKTFNEKMQWLKSYYKDSSLIDKITVKDYIIDNYLDLFDNKLNVIPTLGVYKSFEEIDFNELPDQFVIKCNHDSGGVVVCRDKNNLDFNKAKKKINKSLKRNFYWHGRELVYKNIQPRILIEEYMEDISKKELVDFKFYCFNGEPKFLYVSEGLENHETAKMGFFNLDFEEMPFYRTDYKRFNTPPEKPSNFKLMINIAAEMSKKFPFIRIDLYEINNKVYFSEFTFIPTSGWMPLNDLIWDKKLGDLIELPN